MPIGVRRALNRLAAPSPRPKTPEFRGKTANSCLAATPKIARKTPLRHPEKPAPHTNSRKKVELNTLKSLDSPSERVHT